jgi:hypothetical protein
MHENKYGTKIIITMQEIMGQMDISDKTLHRMIEEGDLPDFTYGSKWSKKKGWHTAVLERHAMEKYEQSNSLKNISNSRQVATEDVTVVPLGDRDRAVPQQHTDLDNRNSIKQKRSSKKMSGSVRPAPAKSRIAAGFTNFTT